MNISKYKTIEMWNKGFSSDLNDFIEFLGWFVLLPFRLLIDLLKDFFYIVGFVAIKIIRSDVWQKLTYFLMTSPYVAILMSTTFLVVLIFQPFDLNFYETIALKFAFCLSVYSLCITRLKELDRRYAQFEIALENQTLENARKQLTLGLEEGSNPEKKELEAKIIDADLLVKYSEADLNRAKAESLRMGDSGQGQSIDVQLKRAELELKQRDLELRAESQDLKKLELEMKMEETRKRANLEFNLSADEQTKLKVKEIDDNLLYAIRRFQEWFESIHTSSNHLELISAGINGNSANQWKVVFKTNLNEETKSPNPATNPEYRNEFENLSVFINAYLRKDKQITITLSKNKTKRIESYKQTQLT